MFQLKCLCSKAFFGCYSVGLFGEWFFSHVFSYRTPPKTIGAQDTIHSRWPIFGLLVPGIGAYLDITDTNFMVHDVSPQKDVVL